MSLVISPVSSSGMSSCCQGVRLTVVVGVDAMQQVFKDWSGQSGTD